MELFGQSHTGGRAKFENLSETFGKNKKIFAKNANFLVNLQQLLPNFQSEHCRVCPLISSDGLHNLWCRHFWLRAANYTCNWFQLLQLVVIHWIGIKLYKIINLCRCKTVSANSFTSDSSFRMLYLMSADSSALSLPFPFSSFLPPFLLSSVPPFVPLSLLPETNTYYGLLQQRSPQNHVQSLSTKYIILRQKLSK